MKNKPRPPFSDNIDFTQKQKNPAFSQPDSKIVHRNAAQLPLFQNEMALVVWSMPEPSNEKVKNQRTKPGYKQTELSIIPKEWEVKTLGSIGRVIRGSSPRPRADKRFYGGEIPRLMVEDVTRDKKFVTPSIDFLTKAGAKLSRPCKPGTLTVVCSGTPTVVGLPSILTVDACIHDGMLALVQLEKSVEPEFLFYALTILQEKLHAAATHGGTFVNLTTTGFGDFTLALPPIYEQLAIAEALSDIDALLDSLDRLIAKKRDIKQAAKQQLLTGKTRLPGFDGEWEVEKLGNCLLKRPNYGINAPAVSYLDRLPSYIRITDITENGRYVPSPKVSVNSVNASQYFLSDGDVLFARTGASVGKTYLYNPQDGPLVFAGFLIRVQPNKEVLIPGFLAAFTSTENYWSWVRLMSMRSGQPGINGNEYAQLTIPLPPIKEQIAITTLLSDMDAELEALEQRREKTRAIKQGMMQELLTGRTRLV